MRFWQVWSRPEPTDFSRLEALPQPRQPGRKTAAPAASRGSVRLPGTGFGGSPVLWASFVVPGLDGPSGSRFHIVFCGALKASYPVERLEITTKGVEKVPSLKSPVSVRMRFGRREIGPEDRFVQDEYESAI